jgi:hypothetical protein
VETHPPFNVVNTPGGVMGEFVNLHYCDLLMESAIGAKRRLAVQEVHGGTFRFWWVGGCPLMPNLPQHNSRDNGWARVSLRYRILPLFVEIEQSRPLLPRVKRDVSQSRTE